MLKLLVILSIYAVFTVVESKTIYHNLRNVDLENVQQTQYSEIFWQPIFPGTKWCGDGDIAEHYDDLGVFKETDMCCRDHDHCDDYIPAGGDKHGLVNEGPFSRLHCKCDFTFYDCLKKVGKPSSTSIGTGYFTIAVGFKCYKLDHPATCVREAGGSIFKRCVEYNYDESKEMSWQWFDLPFY